MQPRNAAYLATASWVFNFACQQYGMLSSPNMKDIAEKYHSFYSPHPFAIAVFFFPQAIIQLVWIYKIYTKPSQEAVRYVPVFALGNFCIGLWMVAWNNEYLGTADIFVNINSFVQLYYVFTSLGQLQKDTLLTHIVAKMFAGIGILDFVDNLATAFFNYRSGWEPNILIYAVTVAGAIGLSVVSDPILGICVVYNFFALFIGQIDRTVWAAVLFGCMVLSAFGVGYKAFTNREEYQSLSTQVNVL